MSGLVINFGNGFVKSGENPPVIGFAYDTFNVRNIESAKTGAGATWQCNFKSTIPRMGVIYTPPNVNRSDPNLSFPQKIIRSLPTDDGVNQIFLAPQARVPMTSNT
jgi:hypothetical protein